MIEFDKETLDLTDAVDVVDQGRQRVHLLEAEGERPARIVRKTLGCFQLEGAVRAPARDVEL